MLLEQAQAHKELIRNLGARNQESAGGIRGGAVAGAGAAKPRVGEYTQVIVHEADRLQSLVDRLLAPHRHPHQVGDVNIHEVCSACAHHSGGVPARPAGAAGLRYSIPEFRRPRN